MSAASSIASFHHWLHAASDRPTACSIVLHGTPPAFSARLAAGIAAYLNEYDDDGDGRWLAVPPELVPLIADHCQLQRLNAPPEACAATSQPGLQAALGALAACGHVVLDSPLAAAATRDLRNVFHVGIGLPADGLADCHLILNPALFQFACLPQIVGDVFLEWLNFQTRKPEPLRGL